MFAAGLAASASAQSPDTTQANLDRAVPSAAGSAPVPMPAPVRLDPPEFEVLSLSDAELHGPLKQRAIQIAVDLTTYEADDGLADVLGRLGPTGLAQSAATASALYHEESWSRGRVIYPQLGGLKGGKASVMVVVEQIIGTPNADRVESRTLDIRLKRKGGDWVFDRLASAGGAPVTPPDDLSPAALSVLNNPRIELPDSARWDIHAGRVSDRLLALMASISERMPFGVIVFTSGHPLNVFGTERQSDHTRGLAVDIYRIGEGLVVEDRDASSATGDLMKWLYEQPTVRNIGGPWALDGYGGRSFTDPVHRDHLHIAVPGPSPHDAHTASRK